jgi:hypothetical protein
MFEHSRANQDSSLYTAPFVCFLQHRYFRLLSTALACFKLGLAIFIAISSDNAGVLRYQHYQFSITNISREKYAQEQRFTVDLLYKGCQLSSSHAMMPNEVLNISYPSPSPIDGFELTWIPEFDAPDLYLELKGSTDHGRSWIIAGSSSYTRDEAGFHNLDNGGAAVRNGKMIVNFRPPWPFYVHHVVSPCVAAVSWVATLLCARFRTVAAARHVALASLAALAIICAAATAGYLVAGRSREAASPLVSCGCAALVAGVLWRAEPLLAEAMVLVGAVLLASTAERVATPCAFLDGCQAALRSAPPVTGPALLAAGVALLLLRRSFCLALRRGVAADGEFYDREWAVFLAAPGAEDALLAAEAGAAALRSYAPGAARHYLPPAQPSGDCDGDAAGSFVAAGGGASGGGFEGGGETGDRPASLRLGPGPLLPTRSLPGLLIPTRSLPGPPLLARSLQRLASFAGDSGRAGVPVSSLDVLYAQVHH